MRQQKPAAVRNHATLRQHLKASTEAQHARLDEAVAGLRLDLPDDLERFERLHLEALTALVPRVPEDCHALVTRQMTALRADLDLPQATFPPPSAALRDLSSLAVRYVLLGARLGTAALARRWPGASTRAGQTPRFFILPGQSDDWRALLDELSTHSATAPLAAQVTDDALSVFDIYLDAARPLFALSQGRPHDRPAA